MTPADHRREAEQAIVTAIEHRQRWGKLTPGTDEADAALDAAFWELKRAEVHALLSHGTPPAPGPRPGPGR